MIKLALSMPVCHALSYTFGGYQTRSSSIGPTADDFYAEQGLYGSA